MRARSGERISDLCNAHLTRPGKPLAFGHIGDTPFIGTPGNPVSLFVTFCLFARPFILRSQGVQEVQAPALSAQADFDWPKPEKRREFVHARFSVDAEGRPRVGIYGSRSSGVLSSAASPGGWATGADAGVILSAVTRRRSRPEGWKPWMVSIQRSRVNGPQG